MKFIKNVKKLVSPATYLDRIEDGFVTAFSWQKSPEGHDYWSNFQREWYYEQKRLKKTWHEVRGIVEQI